MPEDNEQSVEEQIANIDKEIQLLYLSVISVIVSIHVLEIEKYNLLNPENPVDTVPIEFINDALDLFISFSFRNINEQTVSDNKNCVEKISGIFENAVSDTIFISSLWSFLESSQNLLNKNKTGAEGAAPDIGIGFGI